MVLSKQALESILAPENQRYIRRNLELICDNLLDILQSNLNREAKQQVAKCLGRIGYVVDQDFKRYVVQLRERNLFSYNVYFIFLRCV